MKFWPSPPYSCLMITIAKTAPTTGIHQSIPGGMFIARRRPVSKALLSLTVTGLCISFSYTYSETTAAAGVIVRISKACSPKFNMPKIHDGSSAMMTYSMIFSVVILSLT